MTVLNETLFFNSKSFLKALICILTLFFMSNEAMGSSSPPPSSTQENEDTVTQPLPKKRFNDVLTDLLNEFSYSLKKRDIVFTNSVSIRKIHLSENIPAPYETLLEGQILERIRKFTSSRIVICSLCKIKTTQIQKGVTQTTLIANDPTQLDALATRLGIDTWIDIHFSFHESNMGLILHAFQSKTNELVWTRTYTSEELYSRRKNNTDESSDMDSASKTGPEPNTISPYVFSFGLGYHSVPNMDTQTHMIGFSARLTETFFKRAYEVGALIDLIVDPKSVLSNYSRTEGTPPSLSPATSSTLKAKPFSYAGGLYATLYHHLNPSPPQNPPDSQGIRYSLFGAVGAIGTSGYLSMGLKAGASVRLGNNFFMDIGGLYIAPATISVLDTYEIKTPGGGGANVTFGIEI